MRHSFDINVPFRFVKHAKPASPETVEENEPAKLPKRRTLQELVRANTAKLPKIKRMGKRTAKPAQRGSRPPSQLMNIPAGLNQEELMRILGGTQDAKDTTKPPKPTVAEHRADSHLQSPAADSPRPELLAESKHITTESLQTMFNGDFQREATDLVRDARDYTPLSHPTFAVATLGQHRTTESQGAGGPRDRTSIISRIRRRRDLDLDLLEAPNMLSLQGLEPGTVGFDHFLQLSVADSKLVEGECDTLSQRRTLANQPEKLGLRAVDLEKLIDRLSELGGEQQSRQPGEGASTVTSEQKSAEMYTDLFAKLLAPPKCQSSAEENPTGLKVQIEALMEALKLPGLWHDFSYVEWRIRAGQILWASQEQFSPNGEETVSERDVLLLQITLASELLVRLEVAGLVLKGSHGGSAVSRSDADAIAKIRIPKIEWDLVLARQFLDNINIRPRLPASDKDQNRNSVFSAISFFTANETLEDPRVEPIIYPRDQSSAEQLAGLLHFAQTLEWPHAGDIQREMDSRHPQQSCVAYATPLGTPRPLGGDRTSYFGDLKRPQIGRMTTASTIQLFPTAAEEGSEVFDAGGWLSRSWLTCLVLPGEPACHFLISTLLENSPQAIEVLGDSANLYGGFFYNGRSWWSKSCVVGRVLAAATGAKDCMGWISVPMGSDNHADGWLDLDVKELPSSIPRITQGEVIGRDSSPLHDSDPTTLSEEDFSWPADSPPVLGNEVRYEALGFSATEKTYELSKDTTADVDNGLAVTPTTVASLTFTSPTNARDLPTPPSHPLHRGYKYEVIPAASLLSHQEQHHEPEPQPQPAKPALAPFSHMFSAPVLKKKEQPQPQPQLKQSEDDVIVLDCRGSDDLQLLARAWCAKVGENALVGRVGRTCLACCVLDTPS
ncbi:hypothetical protein H2203_006068 [Taxawa tesnikishii (nom. ined.)]|nr:hypothetical protein H2203_006068 [Dothideales sp. JES 119]